MDARGHNETAIHSGGSIMAPKAHFYPPTPTPRGGGQLGHGSRRMTDLDDGVRAGLSPGSSPDPEDGVSDGHAVFGAEGVEQGHGDAEEGHAERATASPAPQTPQQADPVHRRPGDLRGKRKRPGKATSYHF